MTDPGFSAPAGEAPGSDPFLSFLGTHPLPAWVHDPASLQVLAANQAALHLYGYESGRFAQLTLGDLDAAPTPADHGTRTHRRADGSAMRVELAASDVRYAGRDARLVTAREAPAGPSGQLGELRFREALEHAPIGMALVAPDGRWMMVNRALCRITGYSEEELLGLAFHGVTRPGDLDADLAQVQALLAGEGDSYEMEKRYVRRDGQTVWVLLAVAVVRDGAGQPVQFIAQIQDITGQRDARVALRRSEARFRSLIENATDVITVLDADGRIRFGSPSVKRILGYDPDELLGRPVTDFIHPDDHAHVLEALAERIRNPGVVQSVELRFRHRNGEWRILAARGANRLDDPAVRGIVVNSRDVTDRRHAEEELRRTAEHLRELVAAQQEFATAGLNLEPLMVSIAARARTLTGADGGVVELLEGDEMVYRAASGTVAPHQGLRLPVEASLSGLSVRTGQVLRCDDSETDARVARAATRRVGVRSMLVVPLAAEGRRLGVLKVVSSRPHAFGEGESNTLSLLAGVMSAAMRDALAYEKEQRLLAASREAEDKLQSYARELQRSNRELQDFAYVASHDLQEPLRKIQAFGDRLSGRAGDALDEQGRDYLARMRSAAARMQALIQDLLAYSRVATRPQPFVPVNLDQVAAEALGDLQVRIASTGAQVEIGPLPTVQGDLMQMRQLLLNLVGNAVKFHRPGVPPLVRVAGRLLAAGEAPRGAEVVSWAEVTVRDEGIGFDEKYLDRIFSPFQRLHGRGEYEGTGMGLAICRRIAERHGGTLEAHSQPGQGSTFTIRIPALRAAQQEA
ncbi:PAS domain S-box protein [Longimicrobium sp.]|uniref:PAS domain-containing sensor histidine kinase n=1 Tax=Longimicrobium sp. TaxID=2029185 RepID=UPI002F950C3F